MKLENAHILDFQKLYLEEYGVTLTDDEALERATKLIELLQTIMKPITKEDYQKYKPAN
jgi:hypothetical protein